MQTKIITSVGLILAFALFGQEPSRPTVSSVKVLPSEPIPPGTCTFSTAGYLEIKGRRDLSEAEIGQFVLSDLRQGYIITIYPQTKRGVFASSECPPRLKPAPIKVQ